MKKYFGLIVAATFALSACGDEGVSISEKDLTSGQNNADANLQAPADPKTPETTSMDMSKNSDVITNAIDISAGANAPQTVPQADGPMISSDFNKK
jgi:hypothetical protein